MMSTDLFLTENGIHILPSHFWEPMYIRALNERPPSNPFEDIGSNRDRPTDANKALMVNLRNVIIHHMKLRNVKDMGPVADQARQMLVAFLEGKEELQKDCLAWYIEYKTARMKRLFDVLHLFGYHLKPNAECGLSMLSTTRVKLGMKLHLSFEDYMYSHVLPRGSKFADLNCRQVMALVRLLILVITIDYYYGHTNDTARKV
jgi:hypothetical protein